MIFDKQTITPCFNLLKDILQEAFQVETFHYTPPYSDLSLIDMGIRNLLWPNYISNDAKLLPSSDDPTRRFFIIQSELGFYNIVVYLNYEKSPDFISIGPIRSSDFSLEYLQQRFKEVNIPTSQYENMKMFYQGIPAAPPNAVINVTKRILSSFHSFFETCEPITIEFTGKAKEIQFDVSRLAEYSSDYSVHYHEKLLPFLENVARGNLENASNALSQFMRSAHLLTNYNISECQQNLHMLNSYCQLTLLSTNVHPSYILKLYYSLRVRINAITSRDALISMPSDICHKYCLLVKNYAFPEYSQTVRTVLNYIHLHLEEELTLSVLAEKFSKNASSLSAAFSKEVGMSITNYIHYARIQETLKLFNTTNMSVSEAALAAGFHDFAYFSRLFHKQVGCSPREYCKKIR